MIRNRFTRAVAIVLALALPVASTSSCAGVKKAPDHYNTEGKIAYYGSDVIIALDQLRDSADEIQQEPNSPISAADLKTIVEAHGLALQQAEALALVLEATDAQITEIDKFKAAINSIIDQALTRVDPKTRAEIEPWVKVLKRVLGWVKPKPAKKTTFNVVMPALAG